MAKISIKDVSYVYGAGTPFEKRALDGINVDIQEGRITGIIGHTGSGKSTLVQLLNGLARPTSGSVLLDGRDIWSEPKKIVQVRFRVGLVMQYPEYQLFEETVKKDIEFGPRNMGLDEEEINKRVSDAVDFVGLDHTYLEVSPFDLSGGQKRRVAIAGVMAMRPDVLVLDEPAAGLDPAGREAIFTGIEKYRSTTGATIVIVSHSMEDMARFCDDVVVMSSGKLFMSGAANEVFARADELLGVGLDIPEVSKLILELRRRGVNINDNGIYTVDGAVRAISELF
jgi:energy-coupling factor transport system ATP-binding protein